MGHYILQFYNYKSISTIIIIHRWYQTTLVYSTNDLSSGFDRRTTTCKRITFTSTNRGGSRINSGGVVGRSSGSYGRNEVFEARLL